MLSAPRPVLTGSPSTPACVTRGTNLRATMAISVPTCDLGRRPGWSSSECDSESARLGYHQAERDVPEAMLRADHGGVVGGGTRAFRLGGAERLDGSAVRVGWSRWLVSSVLTTV